MDWLAEGAPHASQAQSRLPFHNNPHPLSTVKDEPKAIEAARILRDRGGRPALLRHRNGAESPAQGISWRMLDRGMKKHGAGGHARAWTNDRMSTTIARHQGREGTGPGCREASQWVNLPT